jgi:hypothetical protein
VRQDDADASAAENSSGEDEIVGRAEFYGPLGHRGTVAIGVVRFRPAAARKAQDQEGGGGQTRKCFGPHDAAMSTTSNAGRLARDMAKKGRKRKQRRKKKANHGKRPNAGKS